MNMRKQMQTRAGRCELCKLGGVIGAKTCNIRLKRIFAQVENIQLSRKIHMTQILIPRVM